jgi:hypothetical protein
MSFEEKQFEYHSTEEKEHTQRYWHNCKHVFVYTLGLPYGGRDPSNPAER